MKADKFSHDSLLETFWTIEPAIILLFISLPYFALLYSLNELISLFLRLMSSFNRVVFSNWCMLPGFFYRNGTQGSEWPRLLLGIRELFFGWFDDSIIKCYLFEKLSIERLLARKAYATEVLFFWFPSTNKTKEELVSKAVGSNEGRSYSDL